MMLRSRLAPTPSGLLHLGNAVNFVLTWIMVRRANGALKLRIDDADCRRSKPEFLDDIFSQLDWLGITWDEGPTGVDEFRHRFSQQLKTERYRAFLAGLGRSGHLYSCGCSRKEIRKIAPDGVYPGFCRENSTPPKAGQAQRVRVPGGSMIEVDGQEVALCRAMGDFVLWRKEDQPAYQLASLCDDLDDQINLIVRGRDLLASSAAQLFLAGLAGDESFAATTFVHHPLITGRDGRKLSKSLNAQSLAAMREGGLAREEVYRAAANLAGIKEEGITSLADLLLAFSGKSEKGGG